MRESIFSALLVTVFLLGVLCGGRTLAADTLDEVRSSGKLVWGADQEGGGPYIYPRDDDPNQVTGFEVDLAELLAQYLKVESSFFQGQWDKLPDLLNANKVQIVLNGYEWSYDRAEIFEVSIPYYIYGLQLLVRNDSAISSWDVIKAPKQEGELWKVGVLTGSAAEELMRKHAEDYPNAIDVINYDGGTDAMREVETGKLDATLQDTPIASFYGPMFPKLKPIGDPVGEGFYVIMARQGDKALIDKLNEAIILLIRNGELKRIYQKYGIWDKNQEKLNEYVSASRFFGFSKAVRSEVSVREEMPDEQEVERGQRKRGWEVVTNYSGILAKSAGLTVILSVLSFPLALLMGMLIAIGRLYGPIWLKKPLTAYVEFLRGTPLMLQLYFIFFFLPEVGINVPAFWTGILGLAINYSAYESEIYRAGLQAIPIGQMEAALALGMPRGLALRRIIVPQAVRIVIPPVVNDFIALFKDTSVCSVVTLVELTKRFSVLSMSTQATIELMLMTALLYLLMSYPLSLVSRYLEKKLEREQQT